MLTEELSRFVLPMVRFDGLCLEAQDADRVAAFWTAVLTGTPHDAGGGAHRIDPAPGRPRSEIVRVVPVPRPSPEASRVHLDIRLSGADPAALLDAGADVLRPPGADPWYVLTDPEGTNLCAFPAVDDRPAGIFELVVKCRDAYRLARWWGQVLGGDVTAEGEAACVVGAPEFPWDYLVFDPVPEPKTAPNRMHWHVTLRDSGPGPLVDLGATVLSRPEPLRWTLADPEGNEFCAVVPATEDPG